MGELLIDGARAPPPPRFASRLDCLLERSTLGFDRFKIELSALQRIPLLALPRDVERQAVAQGVGEYRAGRTQCVPHTDFVPDVWIVQCQVGYDKLGKEEVLEHVEMNRAALAVGVSAMRQ